MEGSAERAERLSFVVGAGNEPFLGGQGVNEMMVSYTKYPERTLAVQK